MKIYRNNKKNKIVLGFQWDGKSETLENNIFGNIFGDDDNLMQPNDTDNNLWQEKDKLYMSKSNMTRYKKPSKVAKVGDYIIRLGYTPNSVYTKLYDIVPKAEFERIYSEYKLVAPSIQHAYIIQRTFGEYSDMETCCVLATGSGNQADKLARLLNKRACDDEIYTTFKVPTGCNANLLMPM